MNVSHRRGEVGAGPHVVLSVNAISPRRSVHPKGRAVIATCSEVLNPWQPKVGIGNPRWQG